MADLSLRTRLETFVVPLHSAKALAGRFVVTPPVSLRRLLNAADLVVASRTFHFPLNASTVAGWTEVTISADGALAFRGHLHESGGLSHFFYMLAVIDVRVEPGLPLILAHGGRVHGTVGLGSRDEDWDVPAHLAHRRRLAELWDEVSASPPNYAQFEVNTGVIELIDALGAVVIASSLTVGAEQLAQHVMVF